MAVWGVEPMVDMCQSPGGLTAVLYGSWQCHGAEEALGIIRLACSNTLSVRLCRLGSASPRLTFWSLLGGEGIQLEGLMHGPRSLEPLEAEESFVFLCHC
jgi:hypothetical protein